MLASSARPAGSESSSAIAAYCRAVNMPESTLVLRRSRLPTIAALPTANAIRQPGRLKAFDSDSSSMPASRAPGVARKLGAT